MADASRYIVREGSPNPRGATWDGRGTNFSIFSENATRVELCVFDETGTTELERITLPEYTDQIWHGYVEHLKPGTPYGYRVYGPYAPYDGHRFNPNKLLLDPYATNYLGEIEWGPEIYGYIYESHDDSTFDTRDSAPYMPKCLVTDPQFPWHDDRPTRECRVPWDSTVLYEMHAKGFTKLHTGIPEELRGTYAGLGQPAVVDYLQSLGVTSIELLPIHAFTDEPHLHELRLTNYWGYNTIGFFAPHPRYAAQPSDALREFKQMVARYHERCMEVVLDVVYNHTAEGNERGPTLSFKGIDNCSYYRLQPEDRRYYINDTGTGNTVNVSHPRVLQMICDSLRYWVEHAHVDGFRFDLGTILAREPGGFDKGSGFLKIVMQDPVLSQVKLIAEPWDIGPGGYRVGEFPPGWAEWNDTFRDRTRAFWIGRTPSSELVKSLTGSPEIFDHHGRRPWTSINFVTAHDGFTMADLVSYNAKHNLANGEDNRDGSNNNLSCNFGTEGPTDDAVMQAARMRQMRNLLATLLLSQGTPMLLGGDEFARTQGGNNNAYCQDNAISWVDWSFCEKNADLVDYTRRLLQLRRSFSMLRHRLYLHEGIDAELGIRELAWISTEGKAIERRSWEANPPRCLGMLLNGSARVSGVAERGHEASLLLLVNDHGSDVPFTLPTANGGGTWQPVVNTVSMQPPPPAHLAPGEEFLLTAQTVALLVLESSNK